MSVEQIIVGDEIMNLEEFTRWMCFAEALILIQEKASSLGRDMHDVIASSTSAIEEYIHGNTTKKINGRYHSMLHDVKCELELGNL